jgi:DUF971 family protein
MPTELRLRRRGRVLEIVWADRPPQALAAATLRGRCRCAECTSARRAGRSASVDADVSLLDVQPCGPGALNLHFSDGHRRGIFPFAYLASLTEAVQASESLNA